MAIKYHRIGCGGQCPVNGIDESSIGFIPNQNKLIAVNSSVKIAKGTNKHWDTGIVYLSPYWSFDGSHNLCPSASAGCRSTCLVTSGQLKNPAPKQSQLDKTNFWLKDPNGFLSQAHKEIESLVRSHSKPGKNSLTIRLNGTSDIPFEKKSYTYKGVTYKSIMDAFPNVQFYDYTKIYDRLGKTPRNYHLTFSASEINTELWKKALERGFQVAMVFGSQPGKVSKATKEYIKTPDPLPKTYHGYKVIDGDDTDLTFTRPKGVIIGLRMKGKAENDTTGFVKRDYKLANQKYPKLNPKTNIPNKISPRSSTAKTPRISKPTAKQKLAMKKKGKVSGIKSMNYTEIQDKIYEMMSSDRNEKQKVSIEDLKLSLKKIGKGQIIETSHSNYKGDRLMYKEMLNNNKLILVVHASYKGTPYTMTDYGYQYDIALYSNNPKTVQYGGGYDSSGIIETQHPKLLGYGGDTWKPHYNDKIISQVCKYLKKLVSEKGKVSGYAPFDANTTNLNSLSRELLIEWLIWNDRNGVYSDADSIAEGMNPLTKEEAINIIKSQSMGSVNNSVDKYLLDSFEEFIDNNVISQSGGWSTQDAGYSNRLTDQGLINYYIKEFNPMVKLKKGSKEAKAFMAKIRAKRKIGGLEKVNKRKTTTYLHYTKAGTKKRTATKKVTPRKVIKRGIRTSLMPLSYLQLQDTFTLGKSGRIIYELGYKTPNKNEYTVHSLNGKSKKMKGSVKVNLIDANMVSGYIHTKKAGRKTTVKYTHPAIKGVEHHLDTKSHNVNIRIGMSNSNMDLIRKHILSIQHLTDKIAMIKRDHNFQSPMGKRKDKQEIAYLKRNIASYKKQITELKKHIN